MTEEKAKKEKPLTREDVLRLIEENGGTAKGLDLSGKVFEGGINLRGLDLRGIKLEGAVFRRIPEEALAKKSIQLDTDEVLGGPNIGGLLSRAHLENASLYEAHVEGTKFVEAHLEHAFLMRMHLEGANLFHAHLEQAYLREAHLEKAFLAEAHLDGAELTDTHLQGAILWDAKFSPDTRLEGIDWGDYILGDEKAFSSLVPALATYRRLKTLYTNAGMYDKAGEFFFREMTVKRKALKWWPNPFPRAWSKFISLICGYGERPLRVIGWAASVVLGLAFVYLAIGSLWGWNFWDSLYFSAVSFTALGYGSWLQVTNDWIRGIGAFESFIGVFSMALFLITFVRKMTR